MNLTAPSQVTFILAVFLAVLALLVRYADVVIPVVVRDDHDHIGPTGFSGIRHCAAGQHEQGE